MKHEGRNSRAVLWPCKDCGREVSPAGRDRSGVEESRHETTGQAPAWHR
jgi:hypothetical protein